MALVLGTRGVAPRPDCTSERKQLDGGCKMIDVHNHSHDSPDSAPTPPTARDAEREYKGQGQGHANPMPMLIVVGTLGHLRALCSSTGTSLPSCHAAHCQKGSGHGHVPCKSIAGSLLETRTMAGSKVATFVSTGFMQVRIGRGHLDATLLACPALEQPSVRNPHLALSNLAEMIGGSHRSGFPARLVQH